MYGRLMLRRFITWVRAFVRMLLGWPPLSLREHTLAPQESPSGGLYRTSTVLEYTDLRVMLDEIVEFTRKTGCPVINDDDLLSAPTRLGFASRGPNGDVHRWYISVGMIGQSLDAWEVAPDTDGPVTNKIRVRILRQYLQTAKGREQLAKSFPQGR